MDAKARMRSAVLASATAAAAGPPTMTGVLKKRPGFGGRDAENDTASGAKRKVPRFKRVKWDARFFVLVADRLYYYKSAKEHGGGAKHKGVLHLAGATISGHPDGPHEFTVQASGGRCLHLQAESAAQMQSWHACLWQASSAQAAADYD